MENAFNRIPITFFCLSTSQIDCAAKGGGARKGKSKEENESLSEGYIIQQWIEKGVFQAIEKGYLKSLSFIVAKDGEDGDNEDELGDVGIEVKLHLFRFYQFYLSEPTLFVCFAH